MLSGVNAAVALLSGAFAAVAIASPQALVGSPVVAGPIAGFYVDMYALRALVIAAGVITASLTMRRTPLVSALVLASGGLIQLGDVAIALHFGTPGVLGASIAAALHLASAALLLLYVRRPR